MSLESKANTPGSSLEGYLLIAAPRMNDARFKRSVVLVLHHDEGGAMGVVLNRPIDDSIHVSDQLESVFDTLRADNDGNLPVRIGGPVAGPLIALRPPSVRGGKGGVFLIEGQGQLEQLKMQEADALQFFVGHAGWTSGQLEEELESGWWMTLPAGSEFLEMEFNQMWVTALRESGRSVYREVLGIRGFPADATVN